MPERLSFTEFSDPLCIWAFVAQDKLKRLLDERGDVLDIDYRVLPVFGSVPWRFAEGSWAKGGVQGRVLKTAEIATTHGHPEVTGVCYSRDCPPTSWAPGAAIKAVALLERAAAVPAGTSGAYQNALRTKFFVEGANTARRNVQLEVAEALGVERAGIEARLDDGTALAALWEDFNEAERLKLQGSPTFVFDGGRAMLYGNISYGVLHATVEELLSGLHAEGTRC